MQYIRCTILLVRRLPYVIFKFCVIQVKQHEKFLGTYGNSLWKHSMQLKLTDFIKQRKFQWLRVAGFALGHVLEVGTKARGQLSVLFLEAPGFAAHLDLAGVTARETVAHQIGTTGWVFSQPFKDSEEILPHSASSLQGGKAGENVELSSWGSGSGPRGCVWGTHLACAHITHNPREKEAGVFIASHW